MKKIQRPWGWYENLQQDNYYKVKRLYIEPLKKISLQYHEHRDEHWTVVFGDGQIEIDKLIKNVSVGDYVFIPSLIKHRIIGGNCGIIIIEVQIGEFCEELDIIRIDDDYGRV